MAGGRPARPDEVPRYGSVWTWRRPDSTSILRIAIGMSGARLISVAVDPNGPIDISRGMIWTSVGETLDGWFCIDEGPE